ncbi:MAG: ribose 5-phosphate isomerase A [Weissella confusa]|nr:ribose 5-phosphate isomerase A [Weissella confusa]
MDRITEQKRQAGEYAASLITDGMIVGLGTGSTVKFFIEKLAERINREGLDIVGVTTSRQTSSLAKGWGIKLKSVDEVPAIDFTIDGAVEVVPYGSHQLLKRFEAADMAPTFRRLPDGQRLTTDAGNYIIDLHLEVIEHPQALAYYLEQTIGVVEHGLFLNVADAVIIGGEKLVIIERENVENH